MGIISVSDINVCLILFSLTRNIFGANCFDWSFRKTKNKKTVTKKVPYFLQA